MNAVGAAEARRSVTGTRPRLRGSVARWVYYHERLVLGGSALLLALVVWEVAAAREMIDPLFFSSPSRVLEAAREYLPSPEFREDLRASGHALGVGFGLSLLIGIPVGLLMGWYRVVDSLLDPFVALGNSMPRIALTPLLILWFGIGIGAKVVLIILISVFPLIVNVASAARTIDQDILRVAWSFNARDWQIFRTVLLPATVPGIIAGVRIALAYSLIGVIVGEFLVSTEGLGYMMKTASSRFQTDLVMAGVMVVSVFGVVLTSAIRRIERHFDGWRPERPNVR